MIHKKFLFFKQKICLKQKLPMNLSIQEAFYSYWYGYRLG